MVIHLERFLQIFSSDLPKKHCRNSIFVSSIWSWSIIIQKFFDYAKAKRETKYFQDAFWSGEPLDELYQRLGTDPKGDSERVFVAGMTEWRRSHRPDGALITGAQARIDRSMNVALTRASDKLNSGLYFLATVGSTAPFVGLFGTVWGIKNAFEEILFDKTFLDIFDKKKIKDFILEGS